MTSRRIGTGEEWLAASARLLEREKDLTRMGDELARQRREPHRPRPAVAETGRGVAEAGRRASRLTRCHAVSFPGVLSLGLVEGLPQGGNRNVRPPQVHQKRGRASGQRVEQLEDRDRKST